MKTRFLTLLLLVLAITAPAQTVVRLSNLVEVAYFTNDDRMIVYRGTNPPYVLRGSNLWDTLRSVFLTNAQPPSGNLTNWSAITTASKQESNGNLTAWSLLSTSAKQDASTILANASGTGVLTNPAPFQPATANGTNWAAIDTNALTGKLSSNALTPTAIFGSGGTTVSSNGSGSYTVTSAAGGSGYGWDGFAVLANDTPWINNTIGTNLDGLSFTASANKIYAYQFIMRATTTNTANGMQYQVTLPASFTANSLVSLLMPSTVGAAHGGSAMGTNWVASTTGPGSLVCVITLNGILVNGANAGTVQLRARSEVSGVGATNHVGSALFWKLMN